MKPLNLKEFAESLLLGQYREFAIEILDNLQFVEEANYLELCEDITRHSEKEFKEHEPIRQIDRIGDRLNQFGEIKDNLDQHGFKGDPDDEVLRLIEQHCQIEELLQNAGQWQDGELLDNIVLLLERVPEFDL